MNQIDKIETENVSNDCLNSRTLQKNANAVSLNGFFLMPFNIKSQLQEDKVSGFGDDWQLNFFHTLLFAINDAFYQNYSNHIIRNYKPVKLERADTGAGLSVDLLDNILRKIDKCHFCVSDLSMPNLNVAMEIGYALAKSKPIIYVRQKDLPFRDDFTSSMSRFSDLIGKLYYSVELQKITKEPLWNTITESFHKEKKQLYDPAPFFAKAVNEISPFEKTEVSSKKFLTFLGAWIHYYDNKIDIQKINDFEQIYEASIVRPLYPAILPVWVKLDPSGTDVVYNSITYSTRDDADFSTVFSNAYRRIRILTTNLQGLTKYIEDIKSAIENSKKCVGNNRDALKVEILTLDPESEFVNARGKLIGREISEFRKEMKESLDRFKSEFISKDTENVSIRIYREFPTQITYIIDEYVYSFVVSVNHQSRYNLVNKIEKGRRGVENSFYQHWDTIWARAYDAK